MVKTVGKYDVYHTLGEGSYAKVKFAVNKETKENVAIKILDKEKIQQQNMAAQLKKEIGIMKMVHHEHLVVVKDVFATQKKIFLVLELVEGGELFDKIASEGRLTEGRARFYFKQLVDGLLYCHGLGICHRDLKPENLLLDGKGNLKISDFGVSTLTVGDADAEGDQRAELLKTTCGTPNYVAPEVIANKGYDGKKADVWSCGVILFVLLAGYLPFEEATMVALFKKIKHAEFSYPSWFTDSAKGLINQILVPDPHARISLAEIASSAWLNEPVDVPPPMEVTATTKFQPREDDDSGDEGKTPKAKKPAQPPTPAAAAEPPRPPAEKSQPTPPSPPAPPAAQKPVTSPPPAAPPVSANPPVVAASTAPAAEAEEPKKKKKGFGIGGMVKSLLGVKKKDKK